MADDLRVPPGTTLAFQKLALELRSRAKLDHKTDPLSLLQDMQETVNHLQERWLDSREKGLSPEEAEKRAITLFGDISSIAKALKQPWYARLLFYERCRPLRYFVITWAIFEFAFLAATHPHVPLLSMGYKVEANGRQYLHVDHGVADIMEILSPVQPRFLQNGINAIFLGILALFSVMGLRGQLEEDEDYSSLAQVVRCVVLAFATLAAVMYMVVPSYLTFAGLTNEPEFDRAEWLRYFGLHGCGIIVAWAGALCLLAEIVGFWGLRQKLLVQYKVVRNVQSSQRAWKVAAVIAWVPLVMAAIGGLSVFPFGGFTFRITHANRVVLSDSSSHATISISGAEANDVIREISVFAKDRRGAMEPQSYVTFKFYVGAKPVGSITARSTRLSMDGDRRYFADSPVLDDLVFSQLEEAVRKMHDKPQGGK